MGTSNKPEKSENDAFFRFLLFIEILTALLCFGGCSIIPKKVEFFQDKVQAVPVKSAAALEVEKQGAKFVADKVREAHTAAVALNSPPQVLTPIVEAELPAMSLSYSLGRPQTAWVDTGEALARRIDLLSAKLDAKLDAFRQDQEKNVGKKIEGSGAFQIGYFSYLLWVGGGLFLLFVVVKVALVVAGSATPVGLGLNAAKLTASAAKGLVSQLLSGGEKFKAEIDDLDLDDKVKELVKGLFRDSHEKAQSPENQIVVQQLTRK